MKFDFDPPKGALRSQVKKNMVIALIGQGLKFGLNLISIAVLARLLAPADYGLIAMSAAVTNILAAFREVGLSSAVVQKPKIRHEEVSSLFWVNIVLGAAIALLSIPIGYVAGIMMKDDKLMSVIISLSAVGFVGSFSIQHNAIMQRRLEAKAGLERDMWGQVSGLIAGIAAAWAGWGYWSLVVMQFVAAVVTGIGTWQVCKWRPDFSFRMSDVTPLLSFGWKVMAAGLLSKVANGIDAVVYGTHFGPATVGLFNRAQNLLKRPLDQVINPVLAAVKPALNRAAENPERLNRVSLEILGVISLLCSFVVAMIVPISEKIVIVMLGKAWLDATPIFTALAGFALIEPCASFLANVLVAAGHPDALLRWRLVSMTIIVIGLFSALPWGPVATAATFTAVGLFVRTPLFMYVVSRKVNLPYPHMLAMTFTSAGIGGVACISAILIQRTYPASLGHFAPLLTLFITAALYAGLSFAIPVSRRNVHAAIALLRRTKSTPPPAKPIPESA